MPARQCRLTTLVLMGAYFTATILGGLLHDHDHDRAMGGSRIADDRDLVAGALGSAQSGSERAESCPDSRRGSPRPLSDDDCSVCRFLGQESLPVRVVVIATSHELIADLALFSPIRPAVTAAIALHSRAPPALV
jgi:hypothetical protein